jgi:putative transposase
VSQGLQEGVISRHIILPVPAMCRMPCSPNAAGVLNAFMRCGAQGLDDFYSTVRGQALQGGSLTVLHTPGRHGPYPPPVHGLAPSGGYEAQGACWEPLPYLPDALLRRKWPGHRRTMLRQTLKTEASDQLVDPCVRQSPDGWVTKVQKGAVPAQAHRVARYVAPYVVRPPIAVRRLDRDEGARGTSPDRSHRTERMEHATIPVATCIGRRVQQTMPKGLQRIRYDGVQATTTFARVKVVMQAALAQGKGVVKGAGQIIARLTYRQRYAQRTGRDPFRCPHCRGEMEVWRIWHPTYGVIYDEGEVIKRGTYASTAQRAGP